MEQKESQTAEEESKKQLEERLADLEGRLATYQQTLNDIYGLYDTRLEELSLIRTVSDSLRTSLNLKDACLGLVDIVAHEVTLDTLALLLMDPLSGLPFIKTSFDLQEDRPIFFEGPQPTRTITDDQSVRETARTGKPMILQGSPQGSRLILPLVARDQTIGLFYLTRPAANPFGENEIRVLTIISDQAAAALANLRLLDDLAQANLRLSDSESQARETSDYLESLLEAANDVIFTLDSEGRITYANQKVREWGLDKDQLVGSLLTDLAAEEHHARELSQQLTKEGEQVLEIVIDIPAHGRRDVLLGISRLSPSSNREANFLVLARDITDRKQLEKQLFHSEKLASIGILAAGVAHEIGNPLSAISGYTQILQGIAGKDVQAKEYLEAIDSQTTRIQRIIENLLDYSRPSAGIRSEININQTVQSAMSMLSTQSAFKNVLAALKFDDRLPAINMDRDHLTQILINIALNAAQAMSDGGRLEVTTSFNNGRVLIRLTDSGPGIPEDIRDKIFDPFFSTKPVGQGTGLGLAICYRIAESYGGDITLESTSGQGAAFTVSLPVS